MTDFQTALMLLLVGMITVFVILSLVVATGNAIIWFANNFLPEEIKKKTTRKTSTQQPQIEASTPSETIEQKIPANKLAAIMAAVDVVTGGQGHITSIYRAGQTNQSKKIAAIVAAVEDITQSQGVITSIRKG